MFLDDDRRPNVVLLVDGLAQQQQQKKSLRSAIASYNTRKPYKNQLYETLEIMADKNNKPFTRVAEVTITAS